MIKVKNINIQYKNKIILRNAKLDLENGAFYTLIGRNGSGKTSLFNYIKNNSNFNVRMLRQNVNVNSVYDISIFDFLNAYCIYEKIVDREYKLDKYLRMFELYDKKDQLINILSGGEKQRLFLSQIFIGDSELILLDESFSNLDIKHKILYYKVLKQEAFCRNIPIILIEHDLRLAIECSQHILLCNSSHKKIEKYSVNSESLRMEIMDEFKVKLNSENQYELI